MGSTTYGIVTWQRYRHRLLIWVQLLMSLYQHWGAAIAAKDLEVDKSHREMCMHKYVLLTFLRSLKILLSFPAGFLKLWHLFWCP